MPSPIATPQNITLPDWLLLHMYATTMASLGALLFAALVGGQEEMILAMLPGISTAEMFAMLAGM